MSQPIDLVAGQPFTRRFQCVVTGVEGRPMKFNATDALTAAVRQRRSDSDLFNPLAEWETKDKDTGLPQTGYDQGQVRITGTVAQAVLFNPTVSYTLLVWRTISGDGANPDLIARIPLVIEYPTT